MASKNGRMPESYEPGDLNFHYNRDDREAMLSEETKKMLTKTKLFSMNRRNKIILADIGIILLFTMIFVPIFMGGKSNAKIDGFKSTLKAYEYDGSILVSLKVEASKDNLQEAGLVNAVFSVEGIENSIETIDLLPAEIDKPRILRAEFSSDNTEEDWALVDFEINGKKRSLSTKIKSE